MRSHVAKEKWNVLRSFFTAVIVLVGVLSFSPAGWAKIDGVFCLKIWQDDIFRNTSNEFRRSSAREDGPKVFKLYEFGKMNADYEGMLRKLRPGDVMDFGGKDGRFTFKGVIGYGYNTVIVEIEEGWALRLSFNAGYDPKNARFSDGEKQSWIEEFYELQQEYKQNGVPIVDMDLKKSRPPEFVVVKIENFKFDLGDLLLGKKPDGTPINITPAQEQKAWADLDKFAATTWMYRSLGDFAPRNLGYNGKEWILFDASYMRHAPIYNFDNEGTTFDPVVVDDDEMGRSIQMMMPEKLQKHLSQIVLEKREEMSELSDQFITRTSHPNLQEDYLVSQLTREPLPAGQSFETHPPQRWSYQDHEFDQEKGVKFTLGKLIKQSGNFSSYEVTMKNGTHARLRLLRSDSEKAGRKLRGKLEKLENKGIKVIASGDDYVISKE